MTRLPSSSDRPGSEPERALETHLRQLGIPFVREVVFVPGRRFRADFQVGADLLIEVDGGSWTGGRHTSGTGFAKDAEKASLAAVNGFRVVHCTPAQVESGECAAWVQGAMR